MKNLHLLFKLFSGLALSLMLILPISSAAQKVPFFTLPGVDKKISLSQYQGNVIYIDFWASWCDPCQKSFPWLNEMQQRYGKDGFRVLGINLDESRQNATDFLTRIPANFDIAYDPDGIIAEAYDIRVMPSAFLVNRHGELVYVHKGFRANDRVTMEEKIRHLLASQ